MRGTLVEGMEDLDQVSLRDGSVVALRPVRPEDAPLFERGFERLGEGSRYRRFLGPKSHLAEDELAFFTRPDHHDHEAIGALDPETGEGLGVARFIRDPDAPDRAEAAVAVIDSWQSRGLGSVLLERLALRAAEEGVGHFRACLMTDNRAMLKAFARLGSMESSRGGRGLTAIDVTLPVDRESRGRLRDALRAVAAGEARVARADE